MRRAALVATASPRALPFGLRRETLGLWLGLLGVAIFAVTLPMTRLATGTEAAPQLSPWFVTFARAVLAGVLSIGLLVALRAPRPQRHEWLPLACAVLGNAIGYPLLLGLALRVVTASHAAVVTALLPLATAAVAALLLRQRARPGFWICAVAGSALGWPSRCCARAVAATASASASNGPTCCWWAPCWRRRWATSRARA